MLVVLFNEMRDTGVEGAILRSRILSMNVAMKWAIGYMSLELRGEVRSKWCFNLSNWIRSPGRERIAKYLRHWSRRRYIRETWRRVFKKEE